MDLNSNILETYVYSSQTSLPPMVIFISILNAIATLLPVVLLIIITVLLFKIYKKMK